MGFIGDYIESIRSLQIRQFISQIISLGMIVTSALIIWKGLMCLTGSESPVVVVLSKSMEPGFKRVSLLFHVYSGDILFLHMSQEPIRAGEIVVFNVDGLEIPIVHLVIKVHERQETEEVDILTKGDNNFGDDRLLYAHGRIRILCCTFGRSIFNLSRDQIKSAAEDAVPRKASSGFNGIISWAGLLGISYLPYVGWVTIIMTEKPLVKYLLIGALGLLVITSKE